MKRPALMALSASLSSGVGIADAAEPNQKNAKAKAATEADEKREPK